MEKESQSPGVTEVTAMAAEVRIFLEPKFTVRPGNERALSNSAGHCFCASQVLAYALNERFGDGQWLAGEGVFASPEVLSRIEQGELRTWSDIEDAGQFHGWVLSADGRFLVDITADQFGLAPVIAQPAKGESSRAWLPRYFPDRTPEDIALTWIQEWQQSQS